MVETVQIDVVVAGGFILRIFLSACVEYKLPEVSNVSVFKPEVTVSVVMEDGAVVCGILYIKVSVAAKRTLELSHTTELIDVRELLLTSVTLYDASIFLTLVFLASTTYKFPLVSAVILSGL